MIQLAGMKERIFPKLNYFFDMVLDGIGFVRAIFPENGK
jgi:hypothetical protein